ncbi:MAG: arabinosyltransferase domain-containing protein, partial [Gemmatimonadetes bacterium]|nr:arabinosyltransferase domain-containing protein [Gemmatimonadota bacterium]
MAAHFARHLAEARLSGTVGLAPEPDAATIEAIIDAAFWASLRREEDHLPTISLVYLPPEQAKQPLRFERLLPLAVALAATAVLVLVLRATESRRLLPLALGGVVAGLAFACAPSGLLAAAPFVVLLPHLLPLLRVPAVPRALVAAGILTPGVVT